MGRSRRPRARIQSRTSHWCEISSWRRGASVEYVNFGSAGVKVSRLALGLGLRGQADEKEAERLIRRAFDGGINLFDCANVYGLMDDRAYAGRSEMILGRALKGVRDDV